MLYVFIVLSGLLIVLIIYSHDRKDVKGKGCKMILLNLFYLAWIMFMFWIVWISYSIGMVR